VLETIPRKLPRSVPKISSRRASGENSALPADVIADQEITLEKPRGNSQEVLDELAKKYVEIEKISAEKSRWLRMAAHELRHPVTAILTYAELLLEELSGTTSEAQRDMLHSIHLSGEFMLQLLADLVDIVGESERPKLSLEPTDLRVLLEECISLSGAWALRKNTRIKLCYGKPIPTLSLDPRKTRQVFINLIGNAIKYSGKGAIVEVGAALKDGYVLAYVRDNGPGIPPDEFPGIFEPFQKSRARATSAEPGTGLGLAICKRIVERHGGKIWADSKAGCGATFYVQLKAVREPGGEKIS